MTFREDHMHEERTIDAARAAYLGEDVSATITAAEVPEQKALLDDSGELLPVK